MVKKKLNNKEAYLICWEGGSVEIQDSSSNCKLTYWNQVNAITSYWNKNTEILVDKIREAMRESRIVIHISVIDKHIRDFFLKNFEVYESVKIPVGYGEGYDRDVYQYHLFIRNTYAQNTTYLRPSEWKDEKEKETSSSIH